MNTIFFKLSSVICVFIGLMHLAGTLMPIPSDEVELKATVEVMKETMVPFPVGNEKSYLRVLNGNNAATSLLMFFLGGVLLFVPKLKEAKMLGYWAMSCLIVFAGISWFCFFPIPTVLSILAAALVFFGLMSFQKAS